MRKVSKDRYSEQQLFLVSFMALFLELMVIRWIPSIVQVVAYYANLMLISSFLGLGMGAMLCSRRLKLFRWFPLILLALLIFVKLCRSLTIPGTSIEFRFYSSEPKMFNYLALVGIFVLNAGVFIPLGERIGELFAKLPPLRAYSCDLLGSLSGTILFGLFSLKLFSPETGICFVLVLSFLIMGMTIKSSQRVILAVFCVLCLCVTSDLVRVEGLWSPYHYINIKEEGPAPFDKMPTPPANLRTMMDPPIYVLSINQNFYHRHGTIDPKRYSPNTPYSEILTAMRDQYSLPYEIALNENRALVVGAGGGMDVEGALLAGVRHVDAVEIDPKVIELSRQYNSSGVYEDPRVSIYNEDARAFFHHTTGGYGLIIFGFLDSQALSSSMANIRLDGFVYTVESFRRAYELLAGDGIIAVSFATIGRLWVNDKLSEMLREATGKQPLAFSDGPRLVLIATKGNHKPPPSQHGTFRLLPNGTPPAIEVATDSWPFLYLSRMAIPEDYLIVIGSLLFLSLIGVLLLRPKGMGMIDAQFFFLGMGFLLLETKSIIDCSLYFGATWLVTMIVVVGVLLMVLSSNLLAMRIPKFNPRNYYYLLGSLIFLYVIPTSTILALNYLGRLGWAILIMPLPIFFAGLIFSTRFQQSQQSKDTPRLFGANLIGAMVGGFCEYSGMAIGYRHLSLFIILAYVLSFLCVRKKSWLN